MLAGRCVPYGEGITFWPLREMVRELGAGPPSRSCLPGRRRRSDRRPSLGSPRLGRGNEQPEEIFWASRRLFEAVARERPLVLAFEDVHWAEATFLDLIEYLGEGGRGAPILLVCVGRPELVERRPEWDGGKPNTSTLLLGGFSQRNARRSSRLAALGAPAGRVLDAAGGNPLFVEQMVAMLGGRRPLREGLPIPPTIQALLSARLDRLGPGERAMLARAAVIGRAFPARTAIELLPADARPFATRSTWALVGKELLDRARIARPGQRLSVRARADPAGDVPRDPEAPASRAPRALRGLAGERPSAGAAEYPESSASTSSRRSATEPSWARSATRSSRSRAARATSCRCRRPCVPARRHACDSQPARPSRRAPSPRLDRPRRFRTSATRCSRSARSRSQHAARRGNQAGDRADGERHVEWRAP